MKVPGIKKTAMRIASVVISAMMVLPLIPQPVFAQTHGEVVEAPDPDGNKTVEKSFGDIDVDDEYYALSVISRGSGSEANASAGNLTNNNKDEESWALSLGASEGGKETVHVSGNVYSGNDAVFVTILDDGSKADLKINGNVSGDTTGLNFTAARAGELNVEVSGSVQGREEAIVSLTGWQEDEGSGGVAKVNIGGDVNGVTSLQAYNGGVNYLSVEGDANDTVDMRGVLGGENSVIINGDVNAPEGRIGLQEAGVILSGETGNNSLLVKGNITGSRSGVKMFTSDGGNNELICLGTVKGNKYGIELTDESLMKDNTVVVWKIETGENGAVGVRSKYNAETEQFEYYEDKEIEDSIQYIIRVNQPKRGATLTALAEDGSALAKVQADGRDVEVAHEGDKIRVKIDVQPGYRVMAAYGDEGQTLELKKDANGDYYVEVPNGGGVSISVAVGRMFVPVKPSDGSDNGTSGEVAPVSSAAAAISAAVVSTSAMTALRIMNAALGATVSISYTGGTGLDKVIVDALLARRDLTVIVYFVFEGTTYKVVIPAGADLTLFLNDEGGIDYHTLDVAFGATPI